MFCNRTQDGLEYQFQTFGLSSQRHVESARRTRDGFEPLLIEPRFDECAGIVFHKSAALLRRDRDQISGCRSHAHRVDFEAVRLGCRFSCLEGAALQILAIGHQDQYLIAAGASAQRDLRNLDGT